MVSRDPRSHGNSAGRPASGRTDTRDAPTTGNRVARTPQPMPWERAPVQPRFQRQGEWRPDEGGIIDGDWRPGDDLNPQGGWQSAGSRRTTGASPLTPGGTRRRRTKHQGNDYSNEQLSHENPAWQPRNPQPRGKDRDRESRLALEHLKRRGSPLWDAWERLSSLRRDLQTILPNIALQPLKLERQTLVVTAASSAMAARLRQYEPRLLEGLQARGWLVTRIRFKPTTLHPPREPEPRQKAPVPPRAIESMAALAESEGISPELREALQHFVTRQRGYWGI
ncbi:MAG: DUF721 domain-containing protein [Lautropia sp.]|nr:DUF721 domain-containing protein [Lautropia sp.]